MPPATASNSADRHRSGKRKSWTRKLRRRHGQRRKVLGNAWVDRGLANRNAFNTEFQELITRYAFGEIWTRPHFDDRTRRVLVIGTLLALGPWDEFSCMCVPRSPKAASGPTI